MFACGCQGVRACRHGSVMIYPTSNKHVCSIVRINLFDKFIGTQSTHYFTYFLKIMKALRVASFHTDFYPSQANIFYIICYNFSVSELACLVSSFLEAHSSACLLISKSSSKWT